MSLTLSRSILKLYLDVLELYLELACVALRKATALGPILPWLDGFGRSEVLLRGTDATNPFEHSDIFSWYPRIFIELPAPLVVGCGHDKTFRALLDEVTGCK